MYIYIHISRTRLVELVPRALHHRRLRPHAAAVQSIDRWIKAGGKKMMMMVPPLSFHISTNPPIPQTYALTPTQKKTTQHGATTFLSYTSQSPKQPNPTPTAG